MPTAVLRGADKMNTQPPLEKPASPQSQPNRESRSVWSEIASSVAGQFGLSTNRAPTLTVTIERGVRFIALDHKAREIVFDTRALFLGLLAAGRQDPDSIRYGNSASWFTSWLSQKIGVARIAEVLAQSSMRAPEEMAQALTDGYNTVLSVSVRALPAVAANLAQVTLNGSEFETRHLFGAMLEKGMITDQTHQLFDLILGPNDLQELKNYFVDRIMGAPADGETRESWVKALDVPAGDTSLAASAVGKLKPAVDVVSEFLKPAGLTLDLDGREVIALAGYLSPLRKRDNQQITTRLLFYALTEWGQSATANRGPTSIYENLRQRIQSAHDTYATQRSEYFISTPLVSRPSEQERSVVDLSRNAKQLLRLAGNFARATRTTDIGPNTLSAAFIQMEHGRAVKLLKDLSLDLPALSRLVNGVMDSGESEESRPVDAMSATTPITVANVVSSAGTAPTFTDARDRTQVASLRTYVPGLRTDDPASSVEDLLKVSDEAGAFANLIASKRVLPPFAIGVFGEWGSGKTFFMDRLKDAIALIKSRTNPASQAMFHSKIVQIEFNAWHYIESNLWASLVEYIFKELDSWLRSEHQDVEALFEQLSTSKQLKLSAARDLIDQRKALRSAESELTAARRKHDDAVKAHAEAPLTDILIAAAALFRESITENDKSELTQAAKDLGADELERSELEVAELMTATRNQAQKARLIGNSLLRQLGSGPYVVVTAAVILSIPLGIEAVRALVSGLWAGSWVGNVNSIVVGVASLATSITVAVGVLLRRATRALDTLDKFRAKLDDAVAKATKKSREAVIASERKLEDTRQALTDAERRLAVATDRASRAERDYQNDTARGRLNRFIREKASDGSYAKHLGLVATIRQDFGQLAQIMRDEGLERSLSDELSRSRELYHQKLDALIAQNPNILSPEEVTDLRKEIPNEELRYFSRIVLYIDDLDRCPSDKVADVLQAIHLLLFFPIFVVVVAVDARWIARSLETEFPHLLEKEQAERKHVREESIAADDAANGQPSTVSPATALDYLEKIFHIPFWVRPMSDEASANYVRGLIAAGEAMVHAAESQQSMSTTGKESRAQGMDSPLVVNETTSVVAAHDVIASQARSPLTPNPTLDGTTVFEDVAFALTLLSPEEVGLLGRFARFVGGSPRRAKRYVNLYQLLKTTLNLGERSIADAAAVVALLAMSTGTGKAIAILLSRAHNSPGTSPTMTKLREELRFVKAGALECSAVLEELCYLIDEGRISEQELLAALFNYGPTIQRYSFAGYSPRTPFAVAVEAGTRHPSL